jgi:hypothetical protein
VSTWFLNVFFFLFLLFFFSLFFSRFRYDDYSSRGGGGGGFGGGGFGGGGRGGSGLGAQLRSLDWSSIVPSLPVFQKDFYVEHETTKARSLEEVDRFRRDHQIAIQGSNVPKPIFSFEEANFPGLIFFFLKPDTQKLLTNG